MVVNALCGVFSTLWLLLASRFTDTMVVNALCGVITLWLLLASRFTGHHGGQCAVRRLLGHRWIDLPNGRRMFCIAKVVR